MVRYNQYEFVEKKRKFWRALVQCDNPSFAEDTSALHTMDQFQRDPVLSPLVAGRKSFFSVLHPKPEPDRESQSLSYPAT